MNQRNLHVYATKKGPNQPFQPEQLLGVAQREEGTTPESLGPHLVGGAVMLCREIQSQEGRLGGQAGRGKGQEGQKEACGRGGGEQESAGSERKLFTFPGLEFLS